MHDRPVAAREAVHAFEEDLEEGCYHYDAEDEDAERLESSATDRVAVLILTGNQFCGGPDDSGGQEVQCSIHEGSKHGQRRGEHDDGDLPCEEDRIRGQIEINCERDHLRARISIILLVEVLFDLECPRSTLGFSC